MTSEPGVIPVGHELPPMRRDDDRPRRHQDDSKAKGPTARRKAGDRFAMLNTFVDAGMFGLTKVEALTWLVLFRDTRDGIAHTGESDIAARIGCSRRAVTAALASLRRRGLLTQVFRGRLNCGPSRYRVYPLQKPPKLGGYDAT